MGDPFNTGASDANERVLQRKIQSARSEGRLNIANMELKEIPQEVYKMYEVSGDETQSIGEGPKWYEYAELVSLVAADNEIEEIGEGMVETFGGLTNIDVSCINCRITIWVY